MSALGLAVLTVAISGCSTSGSTTAADVNAGLPRVTLDELVDVERELDFEEIGGIDLGSAAPPGELAFCDAVGAAPIRWLEGSLVPVQYWFDSINAIVDMPSPLVDDAELLLDHAARRIAWNFRRVEKPVVDGAVTAAALHFTTTAVESCASFPAVVGRSNDELRSPWAEGSIADLDPMEACESDRRDVEAAILAYEEAHDEPPRHLEMVEAALLGEPTFFGSDLHVIDASAGPSARVVAHFVGPCANL